MKNLIKSTGSNYAIIIAKIFIGYISVPIFLNNFGQYYFGLFLMAFELPLLLSFLDLGSGKSIFRYTAQFIKDKNFEEYTNSFSFNVSLTIYSSLFISIIILIIGFLSPYLYSINKEDLFLAQYLFAISSISSFVVLASSIPQNILFGANYFYKRNIIQILSLLYSLVLTVCLWFFKFDLYLYSIFYVIGFILTFLFDIWLINKLKIINGVKFVLYPILKLPQSKYFKYNSELFLVTIIAVFSSQMDKQIIGLFIDIKYVATYIIVTKFQFVLKSLVGYIYQIIKVYMIKQANNKHFIQILFEVLSINLFLFFTLVASLLYSIWPYISEFWLKTNIYNEYALWVFLSIINLALSSLSSIIISYCIITDNADVVRKIDVYGVFINISISILLSIFYGFQGVIIGSFVQMFFNSTIFLIWASKNKLINIKNILSFHFTIKLILLLSYLIIQFIINIAWWVNGSIFILITSILFIKIFINRKSIFDSIKIINQ